MDHGGIQRIDSRVKLRETVVSTSARIHYLRYFYVFFDKKIHKVVMMIDGYGPWVKSQASQASGGSPQFEW